MTEDILKLTGESTSSKNSHAQCEEIQRKLENYFKRQWRHCMTKSCKEIYKQHIRKIFNSSTAAKLTSLTKEDHINKFPEN